ncbi:tRNA (adenosine(37)-N6)-threonylcarbamoyltransferase complex transferase subunit TsaD [Candidatus Daviesbacteria bacterium RIFCSPLOWO2_01_FULL_38_10]|nr:MAG: tRNA (adenosine(37)-N6)-threonylcarbamoyltransferase complex transferase subunit TsaD [Candidatus Daviesbacteria bacterium RIFCSPHIGHO2_02_FULL_39_41]OGE37635.1 MAG: tRNA (adenosine(37)-N6)-threonylcarbamoyltransferase complex transferase subunit TsaD [Candidatus Daviesbacteria bacterium RIFCSPLOWO2_01_FULL_38_10]OGE45860.1 MAG: tRNA (adenosine(37)-N6)-threonylcarbamoyltransferase complex transferase subunit TsaD [Candidatus Daviesbacteria bacterium RIFCSPHIGHO2_12_FULL_38_25]OGE68151.1 
MIILGIETTCDETGAAVLEQKKDKIIILSNVVASSASLQAKYGGIIPEQAAREQIKSIIPVIETALNASRLTLNDINAIAVAYGPGLIGSLLVGVETAKTLAYVWNKPLIPVNHLIGHFYANWISHPPNFPCIGLLVSGGHTDLILFTDHGKYKYLGGTRDDAAGECFDKCARLLGLSYPGGPEISKLAQKGKDTYQLPRPMINDGWDFSFSGLKTAVANLINTPEVKKSDYTSGVKGNLAASIQAAIVDVLVTKTIKAAKKYKVKQIILGGGVAANQELARKLKVQSEKLKVKLHIPPVNLCTDNAAMIAAAAFFIKPAKDPLKLQADPSLALKS